MRVFSGRCAILAQTPQVAFMAEMVRQRGFPESSGRTAGEKEHGLEDSFMHTRDQFLPVNREDMIARGW